MACCKICSRKDSKKRVLNDLKVCNDCSRKLKENNYQLIDRNKDINNSLINDSNISYECTPQLKTPRTPREIDIYKLIKEEMMEQNKRFDNILDHYKKQVDYLQKLNEHNTNIISGLITEGVIKSKNVPLHPVSGMVPTEYTEPFKTVVGGKRCPIHTSAYCNHL